MKKLKLLFAACTLMLGAGQAWAQTDVTSQVLNNPSFELSDANTSLTSVQKASNSTALSIYGWTQNLNGITDYNNTEIVDNSTKGSNTNHSAAISAADGSYHLFFRRSWNKSSTADVSFTSNTARYEPGAYTITYSYILEEGTSQGNTTTGSYLTLNVLDGTTVIASNKVNAKNWGTTTPYTNGWATSSVIFSLSEEKTLSLAAVLTPRGGNKTELHLDNFVVTVTPFATSEDYEALNSAIATVGQKTFGFDAGEYAPYNYVEVLKAYAEAVSVDQTANNSQVTIQNLSSTLNSATWTANAEEVNAIWDPTFKHDYSAQSGNIQPIGWYRVKGTLDDGYNVRYVTNSNNAGVSAVGGYGMFTKFAAYYGWEDGYTLPLNASTYYTISFKYGGWGDCKKDGYVTMTDPNSMALTLLPSNRLPLSTTDANSNAESWSDYSAIIKTNDAGNYVLGLRKDKETEQSQYVYGNFMLKSTTVEDATTYYNTVLDEVDDSYDADSNVGIEKTEFKQAIDASITGKTVAEIMEAAANLYVLRDAFIEAADKYEVFNDTKNTVYETLPYASSEKYAAITTAQQAADPTSVADAIDKTNAILSAYRKYVESNALAEGVEGAEDKTNLISDPNMEVAYDGTSHKFGAWQVIGQVDGTIQLLDGESFTDGDGNSNYKYADIYKTDNNAGIQQTLSNLAAGRYMLTVTARANTTKDATFRVFAGSTTADIQRIGNSGGVFDRGWNDASAEFSLAEAGDVNIGVQSGNGKDLWWSATRFRLVKMPDVSIDENVDYTPVATVNNVTLKRTIKANDTWNTIVLPFAVSNEELKAAFGEDVAVAEYSETADGSSSTVAFNTMATPAIAANTPVLLKTSTAGTQYTFAGRTIEVADEAKVAGTNYDFTGSYAAKTVLPETDYFISANTIYSSNGKSYVKGTRAYLKATTPGNSRILRMTIGGQEVTGIQNVEQGTITTGKVFNMQGQEVKSAKKGLYIQNGRKVIIK